MKDFRKTKAELLEELEALKKRLARLEKRVPKREKKKKVSARREPDYKLLAENIQDVFWMSTPGIKRMLYISPAYETIWGRTCESLYESPQSFLEAVHPDDRAIVQEGVRKHAEGKWEQFEYRIIRPDGAIRWIRNRGFPVHDRKGKLVRMVGVASDITELKLAELGLRETNALLEKVFSTGHVLLAYMDRDFNFIRVNEGYAEADERTPDFYPGKNHFELYPNEENEAIFRKVVATGEPITHFAKPFEYAERPERGVTYWDWSLLPVKGASGEVEGVLLCLVDVTQRVRNDEARRRSEERYRLHFEHVSDVLFVTDAELRIVDVSPSVEALIGYTPKEVIGHRVQDLGFLSPEYYDLANRNTRRVLAGQKSGPTEYEFIAKNGARKFGEVTGAPLYQEGRVTGIISVARDITGRKEIEAELVKHRERLEELVEERTEELRVANEQLRREIAERAKVEERLRDLNEELLAALEEVEVGQEELSQQNEELLRTRAEVEAERLRYKELFEFAPDGYIVTDTSGVITEANRNAALMLKTSQSGLVSSPLNAFVSPDDKEQFIRHLSQIMQKGSARNWETVVYPKEGPSFFSSISASVAHDAKGVVTGIRWLVNDITQRKKAEEAIRQANERIANILSSINDGFFSLDNNLVVTYFNKAAEQFLNRKAEDVIGRPLFEAFPEAKGSIFEEKYTLAVKEKVSLSFESYFGVAPYENWYYVRVFPFENGISVYFLVTTEQKKTEQTLTRRAQVDAAFAEMSGALIESVSLEDISDVVLKHARQLTQSPHGFAGYGVPGTDHFVGATLTKDIWERCEVSDKSFIFENLSLKPGLDGWVWKHQEPVLINNPSEDPRCKGVPPGHVPISRLIMVPAMVGDERFGMIAVANSERDYTEEDLKMVKRLSELYALAIQRKQAEEALSHALERARQYSSETAGLLEGVHAVLQYQDFEEAARAIFKVCKQLTGATSGYVSLIDATGTQNGAVFIDSGEDVCAVDPSLPMPIRGLRAEAYRSRKPVYENRFEQSEFKPLLPPGHSTIKNVLFAPLLVGEKAIGLIGLANKPEGFTEDDARLAAAFAGYAAIAFRNSRYLTAIRNSEERYRRLSEGLEDLVREKVEELRQAQTLASIGQMVSVVAHEVRNPLQNIRMGMEHLQRVLSKGQENDEVKDIFEEITYGANMLDTIIGDLLDYSRPVHLNRLPCAVCDIVDQAITMVSDRLVNVRVRLDLESSETEISVDPEKIVRVLINLISNAADAMPNGGDLRISSGFTELGGVQLLKLCVSDTGCGINDEHLDKVFEPFFTTKTKGTGLGVSICRKIVEAHSGSMSIASRPGEGTMVEICLPTEPNVR
ncbi:MAG: hypothetical protein Kow0099_03380 [Candidatus Abyssubacteria bacterium]